jgi:long-chain acyl-CoA synthetase
MANVYDDFADVARRFADRTAVELCRRDGTDEYTYAELQGLASRVASLLASQGVQGGDRCAILADNDARWCAAYLGTLKLGAVAVPLDTAYRAAQVRTVLADSGSGVLLVSSRYLPVAREAATGLSPAPVVVMLAGTADGTVALDTSRTPGPGEDATPSPATPADAAVILYTSGTTSDPKGVVLTHGNLQAERDAAFKVVHVTEDYGILGVLPLFHALAQVANLLLPFTAGARVVFLETINSAEIMRAFSERGINAFCVVPQFYYLLHQRIMEKVAASPFPVRAAFRAMLAANAACRTTLGLNLGRTLFTQAHAALGGRMRVMVTGGSRFDPGIGRDLYAMGFNILQAYGLTECSGAATVMRPGDPHVEAAGQPLDGVEIRIDRDSAGEGRDHPDGEVLIRGPIVMAGYHNRPDVNAVTLADGWLHTGDLGYLDPQGRLTITGRLKEIIVLASGKNIYPEEIETHYAASPFIKEICVLGVAVAGEPSAERLHAVVVPNLDVMRERRVVNFREIIRFDIESLSLTLPHYKRVLSFDVWRDDLPRTTTRKLKRHEIERVYRERAQAQETPAEGRGWTEDDHVWAADPHAGRALAVIRAAVKPDTIVAPHSSLELDLGLDSMERVELLAGLEHTFGTDVDDAMAQSILTVRDLVEAVRPAGPGPAAAGSIDADPWARVLADDVSDPVVHGILKPKRVFSLIAFLIVKGFRVFAGLFMGLKTAGLENLPKDGPFLLSPNHQSYLDAFLLVGALPYRTFKRLFFVGASEYFASPLTRRLASLMNVVPVDPDANLVRAMQAGAFGLRHDRVLVLFPEGERSPDGTPRTFKKGAAITALQMRVPIVPVAIRGVFEIWPRGKPLQWRTLLPWWRTRPALRFGPPLRPEATPGPSRAERYERHTAALRQAIVSMWEMSDRTAARS